jgi:RNA polymerase sigma-70 factor (ECF subfamily)
MLGAAAMTGPGAETVPERIVELAQLMAASNELDSAGFAGDSADAPLVAALRVGDEAAFRGLVLRHHAAMVRLARASVSSHAVAEEVAQETWLAVIQGIDGFEGRSSLKSWIFAILVNRARSRGVREKRIVPMSSLGGEGDAGPAIDADRFVAAGQRWGGHWCSPPVPWEEPAERLIAKETRGVVTGAIEQLPARQRAVVSLRDIEGWSPEEVCALLELSEGNQRVLLHRGRARVRAALEDHLGGGD